MNFPIVKSPMRSTSLDILSMSAGRTIQVPAVNGDTASEEWPRHKPQVPVNRPANGQGSRATFS
jgi:hypothetical protein